MKENRLSIIDGERKAFEFGIIDDILSSRFDLAHQKLARLDHRASLSVVTPAAPDGAPHDGHA